MNPYFISYRDYFWQWEEGGVIAIPDSYTITYSGLLEQVLKGLCEQGLPRLGSLLLVISALNENGVDSISSIHHHFKVSKKAFALREFEKHVHRFLTLLTQLPDEYKTGEKKLLLLQTIFEDCKWIASKEESLKVLNYLKNEDPIHCKSKASAYFDTYIKDLRTFSKLNKKYRTVADILNKMANVPQLTEELKIEKEEEQTSEAFIDELKENSETFKVAALVKRIWSGINLPFHSSIPSQQPTGGVSDLTNKGNFDRLLISEFANDDLTFLSRLANNEALYLNRESPPQSNDKGRILLIDISLRNWGTPKILSFATMLAIAKHPKNEIECKVYVLGDSVFPVKYDSVHTIIEALTYTEATIDSSKGIAEFIKEKPVSMNTEVFLLTERSVIKQQTMQKVLAGNKTYFNYLILNDSDGKIDVYKNGKNGKKHLQQLKLPLEKLWKNKSKRHKEKFDVTECPILLKNSKNHYGIFSLDNGDIVQVTKDKTLLRNYRKQSKAQPKGWEIIAENLPLYDKYFAIGVDENGDFLLLASQPQSNYSFILHNINTKVSINIELLQWKFSQNNLFYYKSNEKFYFYNDDGVWSIDKQGKLEESNLKLDKFESTAIHQQRMSDIASQKLHTSIGVFKNVRLVGVNSNGNLVFNKHQLQLEHSVIKLRTTEDIKHSIEAEKITDTYYEFKDGSTVEINKSGFFILTSSDSSIPQVFIPSVINQSIGMATQEEFAGNSYYVKENYSVLKISERENMQKEDGNKLCSFIERKFNIPEFEVKTKLTGVNCEFIVPSSWASSTTYAIERKVQSFGVKTKIEPSSNLKVIDTNIFFKKYITPFIQTIQNYGA